MTSQKSQSRFAVYILAFVAILCWGVSFLWTDKLVRLGIPVFYFVFLRTVIAGLVLLLISVISGKFQPMEMRDAPKFMLLALFQPLVYFLAESYGLQETGSPTVSSMLIASSPLFCIAAGRIFCGERISRLNFAGVLIAIGGICLMVFSRDTLGPHFIIGILLLVVAVSSEAGNATVTKKLSMKYSSQTIVMYQFLFGSVYLLPLFLTLGISDFEPSWLSLDVWGPVICLGVLCSAMSFTLWATVIRCLGVSRSSMISTLIPVVSALAAMIIGREILSIRQWAGIVIAVVGVALSQHVKSGIRRKSDGGRNNL